MYRIVVSYNSFDEASTQGEIGFLATVELSKVASFPSA